MKFVQSIHPCRIKAGKNASDPQRSLAHRARHLGASYCDPWAFLCLDCKCKWGEETGACLTDISIVSCSNCYSDNVMITSVRAHIPEWRQDEQADSV